MITREQVLASASAQATQTSEQLKSPSTGVREFKVPMSGSEYLKKYPITKAERAAPRPMSFEEQMDLGPRKPKAR